MSYDCKETIPELFFLPEMFLNMNRYDFGQTQSKIQVNFFYFLKNSHEI